MQSKCDWVQAGDLHMTNDISLGDLCRLTFLESKHLFTRGGLTTGCLDFSEPLRDGGVLPCFGCNAGSPCP